MAKTAEKENKVTTASASARFLRLSPRKARLVTNLVKDMYAVDALAQLRFVNKKAAPYVREVIKSAVANGENNFKFKPEDLYIVSITCDAGPKLKRYMPRAQGRAGEIRRPLSHINVVLEERTRSGKRRGFELSESKKKSEKAAGTEKTAKQDVAEEKNKPAMRNEIEKTQQDIKKNTVQQKRRLFNRKSGV